MRLINNTIRPLIWYALLIFSLSVPAYFLLLNAIWQNELDAQHRAVKQKIATEMNALKLNKREFDAFLTLWSQVEPGVTIIQQAPPALRDSVYTFTRFDKYYGETEQFRALRTSLRIKDNYYRLDVVTNMEESDETLYMIAALSLLFFLLLLAGFVWISRRTSKKLWQPFYETLGRLRKFDLKKSQQLSLPSSVIEEFNELNRVLSGLINNSVEAYRQQKEFTENASHELQTPVAILKSKIDLILQDNFLNNNQAHAISELQQPVSRLSRIIKNLLLFARIENYRFEHEEKINVKEVLQALTAQIAEYSGTGRKVILTISETIELTVNKILFEILINNLLVNAVKYSTGEEVMVSLKEGLLTVSNEGKFPLRDENLFKRYITASPEASGSGLGLAIVKEICEKYFWKVQYDYNAGFHHFKIIF